MARLSFVLLALLLLAAGAPLVAGPAAAQAPDRIALVIGNARYDHAGSLSNPPNDAADIARALRGVGFEVTEIADAGFDRLRRALAEFGDRADRAEVAVIYFAGHGIELDQQNYLLPVDADLADARDVAFHAVPLSLVRRAAEPASRLSLVIVDACRNNPFLEQMRSSGRSLSRGLAREPIHGQDTLVAFAAREGTVAEDGDGRNSPYAAALVRALAEPGLEIGKLFRRVRDEVRAETRGRQEPALYGSLSEADFFFVPPEGPEVAAAEAPGSEATATRGLKLAPAGALGAAAASQPVVEITFWNAIAASDDPRDFEDYLRRFPEGTFAGIARRRLEVLRAESRQAAAAPGPSAAEPSAPPEQPAAAPAESAPTLARVEPAAEAPSPAAAEPDFVPTRTQVRDAQARLAILGHDAGPEDGIVGGLTLRAIRDYRRAEGLGGADHAITPELLARLARAVPEGELAAHRARAEAARAEAERAEAERREAARAEAERLGAERLGAERAAAKASADTADPAAAVDDDAPRTAALAAGRVSVTVEIGFRRRDPYAGCLDPVWPASGTLDLGRAGASERLGFDALGLAFDLRRDGAGDAGLRMRPLLEGQEDRDPLALPLPSPGRTLTETRYLDFGSAERPRCGNMIAYVTLSRD